MLIFKDGEKNCLELSAAKNVKMRKLKNNEFKILMWGEKKEKSGGKIEEWSRKKQVLRLKVKLLN